MTTTQIPAGARVIRTYTEFRSYVRDFVDGYYPFLIIIGRPGLGKTECERAATCGRRVYYRKGGNVTPLQVYKDAYNNRNRPMFLDDVEPILNHPLGAQLISALGDTNRAKLLSYGTTSRLLGDVPQSFLTTSPLCIITNRTTFPEYLLSRAVVIVFDPTNQEIHKAVAEWYWDQEIHDWFGQHVHRLPPLDARWYVIAAHDKRAGRDWQRILLETRVPGKAECVVQELENDPAYPTRKDKARRFVERMNDAKGASRSSYFRIRQQLELEGRLLVEGVPSIPLRRTRPPGTPSQLELDAMGAEPPPQPEEEPRPVDVPAREQFTQPINGHTPTPGAPRRMVLDDTVSWKSEPDGEADEEEE
jgi:hypothetical protein